MWQMDTDVSWLLPLSASAERTSRDARHEKSMVVSCEKRVLLLNGIESQLTKAHQSTRDTVMFLGMMHCGVAMHEGTKVTFCAVNRLLSRSPGILSTKTATARCRDDSSLGRCSTTSAKEVNVSFILASFALDAGVVCSDVAMSKLVKVVPVKSMLSSKTEPSGKRKETELAHAVVIASCEARKATVRAEDAVVDVRRERQEAEHAIAPCPHLLT